jgi:hypothetical protein
MYFKCHNYQIADFVLMILNKVQHPKGKKRIKSNVIGKKLVNFTSFLKNYFSFTKLCFLTCYLDPDPHSFSKLDPNPHSLKKRH